MQQSPKIRWAPKVPQSLVKRLYDSDAAGLLDLSLLEDVGVRLLLRCESIVMGTRLEVFCPICGTRFAVDEKAGPAGDQAIACPGGGCSWSITRAEYKVNRRHRDLGEGAALPAFSQYLTAFPAARSPEEKMRAIDQLIHAFHWDLKDHVPNRVAANNLLEGSLEQVCAFLDALSARDDAAKTQWRQTVQWMWRRRRNQP